jgi:hypothetical protein
MLMTLRSSRPTIGRNAYGGSRIDHLVRRKAEDGFDTFFSQDLSDGLTSQHGGLFPSLLEITGFSADLPENPGALTCFGSEPRPLWPSLHAKVKLG